MQRIAWLFLVLTIAAAAPAAAEDKAAARDAYRRGTQDYNLGDYKDALVAFKEAYRHFEDPSFLFNIGQCHRMIGENVEAVRAFKAYLRESERPPNRAEVERLIVQLEALVRAANTTKATPPQGTMGPGLPPPTETKATPPPAAPPPPVATAPTPAVAAAPPPAERTPVYKKWWFWTIIVGVVGAGVGVGLGLGLTQKAAPTYPSSPALTDGTVHF